MKKAIGKSLNNAYMNLDEETGELKKLVQPYAAMSLRPAIAKEWFKKYHRDMYNADKDFLHLRGKKMKPAKYYDKLYDTINSDHLAAIKKKRKEENEGLTDKELRAREKITHARTISKSQI